MSLVCSILFFLFGVTGFFLRVDFYKLIALFAVSALWSISDQLWGIYRAMKK